MRPGWPLHDRYNGLGPDQFRFQALSIIIPKLGMRLVNESV
jgi:hypothetical protein